MNGSDKDYKIHDKFESMSEFKGFVKAKLDSISTTVEKTEAKVEKNKDEINKIKVASAIAGSIAGFFGGFIGGIKKWM